MDFLNNIIVVSGIGSLSFLFFNALPDYGGDSGTGMVLYGISMMPLMYPKGFLLGIMIIAFLKTYVHTYLFYFLLCIPLILVTDHIFMFIKKCLMTMMNLYMIYDKRR